MTSTPASRPWADRMRAALASFGLGGLQNAAALAGAGLISHGVWRIHEPAGQIVAGLFALGFAFLLARMDR